MRQADTSIPAGDKRDASDAVWHGAARQAGGGDGGGDGGGQGGVAGGQVCHPAGQHDAGPEPAAARGHDARILCLRIPAGAFLAASRMPAWMQNSRHPWELCLLSASIAGTGCTTLQSGFAWKRCWETRTTHSAFTEMLVAVCSHYLEYSRYFSRQSTMHSRNPCCCGWRDQPGQ